MDQVIAAPSSRNAPCACGSGLRYKECHGSLGGASIGAVPAAPVRSIYRAPSTEWGHLDAAAGDACGVLMETALHNQTSGRFDEAARDYREVLARAPDRQPRRRRLLLSELSPGHAPQRQPSTGRGRQAPIGDSRYRTS